MKNRETARIVRKIIAKISGDDSILVQSSDLRYLDSGIVDSMSIIELIIEIEDAFDIELNPKDTESDQFRTIEGLVKMIQSKTSGDGAND